MYKSCNSTILQYKIKIKKKLRIKKEKCTKVRLKGDSVGP